MRTHRTLIGNIGHVHHWEVENQKAATFIRWILPHLVIKRRQAEVMIRLCAMIASGRRFYRVGAAERRQRIRLMRQIQALNQKYRAKPRRKG